jgi:hypothetical protein
MVQNTVIHIILPVERRGEKGNPCDDPYRGISKVEGPLQREKEEPPSLIHLPHPAFVL